MDYFNRKYIFQPLIFRGHVSFPRSIYVKLDFFGRKGLFHLVGGSEMFPTKITRGEGDNFGLADVRVFLRGFWQRIFCFGSDVKRTFYYCWWLNVLMFFGALGVSWFLWHVSWTLCIYEAFGKHHHCLGTSTLERFLASGCLGGLGMGAFWVGEGYYLRCFSSQDSNHRLGILQFYWVILRSLQTFICHCYHFIEGKHHKVLDVLSFVHYFLLNIFWWIYQNIWNLNPYL